jgi:predicted component of type VI protein secretion system
VPLDGTGISREHLRLHSDGDALFVTDLSSNGTWLNTRRLTRDKPHALTTADAIQIPGFEIRIELPNLSAADGQQARSAAPAASGTSANPAGAGGPLQFMRDLEASLSKVEKLLIALALASFVLVLVYLAA